MTDPDWEKMEQSRIEAQEVYARRAGDKPAAPTRSEEVEPSEEDIDRANECWYASAGYRSKFMVMAFAREFAKRRLAIEALTKERDALAKEVLAARETLDNPDETETDYETLRAINIAAGYPGESGK